MNSLLFLVHSSIFLGNGILKSRRVAAFKPCHFNLRVLIADPVSVTRSI